MREPGAIEDEEPPGGRALQRLQQFEEERGFEPTEVPHEDVAPEAGDDDLPADDDEEPEPKA